MKIWSIKWPGSSIWTCWRTSAWWSIWEEEYSPWTWQVCSWRYLRCMRSSNPPHTDSADFPPRGSCRLGELWNYSAVWGETFLAFLWQDPARQATNLHQISHPRGLMTRQQCNDTNDKVDIRQSVSQGLQQRPAWTMTWSDFVNNLVMTQLNMLRNISKYKVVNLPVYFYCWSKWPLMSDLTWLFPCPGLGKLTFCPPALWSCWHRSPSCTWEPPRCCAWSWWRSFSLSSWNKAQCHPGLSQLTE